MNAGAAQSTAAIASVFQDDRHSGTKRRSFNSKNMGSARNPDSGKHVDSIDDRLPLGDPSVENMNMMNDEDSAIADDLLPTDYPIGVNNSKARRASEGSHLSKVEGKRSSGELRCEKCGKGYKHSSCLTKHLSVSSDPFVSQLLAFHLHPFLPTYFIHHLVLTLLLLIILPLELT